MPTLSGRQWGKAGTEEKVETICPRDIVKEVIVEVKKIHPYEEVALEIIPLEEI